MSELDQALPDVQPHGFLNALQIAYPLFAEKTDKGHPKQQDADECFQSMLQSWRAPLAKNQGNKDLIGNLFEIELESELQCVEVPDEKSASQSEKVLRLSCHIDNSNKPIDLISEGLKVSLEGQIEKFSPTLGRNSVYNKQSRISKLVSLALLLISF